MCGLAGIATGPRTGSGDPALAAAVADMADALHHRGPDAGGSWLDPEGRLALGHRRLAVIDLSEAGAQPMHSSDGRMVLAFNGEVYNFRALRAELARAGAVFRGHSDTEVLVEACAAWGVEKTLERVNGMFAFALWDAAEGQLHLARDRFGEKPLYYAFDDGRLLFASELKALRRAPGFHPAIDREALAHLLARAYVPAPLGIYTGVRKLPPGCWLSIDCREAPREREPRVYWDPERVARGALAHPRAEPAGALLETLEPLLRRAVAERMEADVPMGAFLSGGIDSSVICALMQAESSAPVRTFSVGFEERAYDEAPFARAVAGHLGTEHTEVYVSAGEARAVIPSLPETWDEPFADSSQIPTALIARIAREHVTVALSGDAGDELFGGYNRYVVGRRYERLARTVPLALRRLLAAAITALPPPAWDRLLHALAPVIPRRLHPPPPGSQIHKLAEVMCTPDAVGFYRRLTTHWPAPEQVVAGVCAPGDPYAALLAPGRFDDALTAMMFADTVRYLPDDILVKVDRAAMAVSLETRIPFLDPAVFEFAWSLPVAMKLRGNQGKWLLRRLLGRHVPERLFDRRKAGFAVPIDHWLRGPLREWADDLLAEDRLRREGFLHAEPVRALWAEHRSGRRNHQHALWAVLMFQAWLEHWHP